MKIMSEEEVLAAVRELALQVGADSPSITSIVCAYALKGGDAHSLVVGRTNICANLVCLLGGAVSLDIADHSVSLTDKEN